MPPRKRKWIPGPNTAKDLLEQRYAWANNFDGEFVVYVQDPVELFTEDGKALTMMLEHGAGKNVHLQVNPTRSRSRSTIMLTSLNERELLELKELFDLAFEWALPIVQLRDREAREALEKTGDDANPRNYRQVPQLVVRKRPSGEHGEVVQIGSEDVPRVGSSGPGYPSFPGSDPVYGPGGGRDAMADEYSEDGSSQDDEEIYYESTELGHLDGAAPYSEELLSPDTWPVHPSSDTGTPGLSGEAEGRSA